jgi:hypothetical protein
MPIFNRVREGLRVIEDGLRFIYTNEKKLKEIREIRHLFSKKHWDFLREIYLKFQEM